jgi:hypothetical protein
VYVVGALPVVSALEDWPAKLASAAALWRLAVNAAESPEEIRARAGLLRRWILLPDSSRAAVDLCTAQATPEFFLVDRDGILRYRGAFDDSTFRARTPSRFYLADALRALLGGRSPKPAETPAYGCAIERWKM